MSFQKTIPLYPHVAPEPGTPLVEKEVNSALFSPLQVRGLTVQNRIAVSPMGMFSANDGHLTDFHLVHYGSFATRGAALVIIEATAVAPNARVSTGDSGLWQDSQIAPLKRVVDYIHSQGQNAGIQLCHSGPKGSMLPLWLAKGDPMVHFPLANEESGGWPDDVWAPSAICHGPGYPMPKEMGYKQIDLAVEQFASAARRAAEAGVDFIELHGAHGYLINAFLSPLTNHRIDEYGGSFENRTRFLFRVLKAVRDAIPDTIVLSLRISAVEWMEWSGLDCWTLEESIQLAKLLPKAGVDILDVSSGGNHSDQKIDVHPYYQVDLAYQIRQAIIAEDVDLLIAAVGFINNPAMAESVVRGNGVEVEQKTNGTNGDAERGKYEEPQADLVMVGRQFLRDAGFVLTAAKSLGEKVQWPLQYSKGNIGCNRNNVGQMQNKTQNFPGYPAGQAGCSNPALQSGLRLSAANSSHPLPQYSTRFRYQHGHSRNMQILVKEDNTRAGPWGNAENIYVPNTTPFVTIKPGMEDTAITSATPEKLVRILVNSLARS
ncbi:NADPH dehydrogenase [Fusarium tjaetaba]|uniref:NADPH dehydrogenase n=1 Tax=Fusarium tjaetaba TaxID=1567544 RepID=A0A8H5VED7_9HYPO|nr:NADPH dehydrogenase [Fusarium tjaetaba]KAF5618094.1 NADPH dehydrogenase [Fusarium tjaetaba]